MPQPALDLGTIIHGYFIEGILRGVGELRSTDASSHHAEAAFSVEADWQRAGIGSELMQHTLLTARNRGIAKVFMNCLHLKSLDAADGAGGGRQA